MPRSLLLALALCVAPALAPAQTAKHQPRVPLAKQALTAHEQAMQLLNRFTFGARPGDLEHVLAVGPEAWLEGQLDPDHIPDPVLARRLADLPTLAMTTADALAIYPDRQIIKAVAEGKRPYPSDPELAAVYQVQVIQYLRLEKKDKDDAKAAGKPDPKSSVLAPDVDSEPRKEIDRATARRIAGELLALPARERMPALLRLPVDDRIAFARRLSPDLRSQFVADLTPRDRELFNTLGANANAAGGIVAELQQGKLLRDILSERQLLEVMTDFWFNHFNVDARKESDRWYTTRYEGDAIRAHALGHFSDLLLATATSPAMMVYLDNWLSIGPDSQAAGVNPNRPNPKRNNKGLNENYGRELMELHTLSVNGGYTQADVTALSSILTGWTVDRPYQGGPFLFDPRRHEPGPKQWLDHTLGADIPAQTPIAPSATQQRVGSQNSKPVTDPGMAEGLQALTLLAQNPRTAHFIAYLIAQRFVADTPPASLVDRLAATYTATNGDIQAILRTLAHSPEFNSRQYLRNKVKTPLEFVASTFRATATDPTNPAALASTLRDMGMPLFECQPPTGYLLTGDHWMNSAALVDRLNFAYALTENHYSNQKFDAPRLLAYSLMTQPVPQTSNTKGSGTQTPVASPQTIAFLRTSPPDASAPTHTPEALHLLEANLLGAPAAAATDRQIQTKSTELTTPASSPTDTLNLLTALILGSPDFQLH